MPVQELTIAEASLALGPIALVALAVRQDIATHRISNWLTFGALGVGLLLAAWTNGFEGIRLSLAGAAVGLACLIPLYLARGMGAGDVKLMAAAGSFLGPYNAFVAAMLTLAAGAVFGFALLAWRIFDQRRQAVAAPSSAVLSRLGKERFPYAAAIAAGVVATLWLRGFLKPLAGSLA